MTMNVAVMTRKEAYSDCRLAKLQKKVEFLQGEIERITMLTERKKRVLKALRSSMESCGYDLDSVMGAKCRERTLVDLRSIAWSIYKVETSYSCQQIAEDFGWDRTTIFCAIRRANELKKVDRNFADIYDTIFTAFKKAMTDNINN